MAAFLEGLATAFDSVIQATLQATVLAALVLVLQRLLRKRLAPRWHYALWLLVLLRLFLPWTPESPTSVFNYVRTEQAAPSQLLLVSPDIEFVQFDPAIELSVVPPVADYAAAEPVEPSISLAGTDWLRLVWLGMAGILLLYVCAVNGSLWWRVRREPAIDDGPAAAEYADCKRAMSIRASIRLIRTRHVSTPALLGLLRPRLLLPESMERALSREELRHVFLHELAHYRRGDLLVNWLMVACNIVHWFNPALWYAFHRMRADRELACDALAMSYIAPDETPSYGRTLLRLLEHVASPRPLPGLVGVLERRSHLKKRIRGIAGFRPGSYRWSILAVALIAVLSAVALTNGSTNETTDELPESTVALVESDKLDLAVPSELTLEVKDSSRRATELSAPPSPITVETEYRTIEAESVQVDLEAMRLDLVAAVPLETNAGHDPHLQDLDAELQLATPENRRDLNVALVAQSVGLNTQRDDETNEDEGFSGAPYNVQGTITEKEVRIEPIAPDADTITIQKEIRRVLRPEHLRDGKVLDLRTGQIAEQPDSGNAYLAWSRLATPGDHAGVATHGIELWTGPQQPVPELVRSFRAYATTHVPEADLWNSSDVSDLPPAPKYMRTDRVYSIAPLGASAGKLYPYPLPYQYAFQTVDGDTGVFEIMRVEDRNVYLRYKFLEFAVHDDKAVAADANVDSTDGSGRRVDVGTATSEDRIANTSSLEAANNEELPDPPVLVRFGEGNTIAADFAKLDTDNLILELGGTIIVDKDTGPDMRVTNGTAKLDLAEPRKGALSDVQGDTVEVLQEIPPEAPEETEKVFVGLGSGRRVLIQHTDGAFKANSMVLNVETNEITLTGYVQFNSKTMRNGVAEKVMFNYSTGETQMEGTRIETIDRSEPEPAESPVGSEKRSDTEDALQPSPNVLAKLKSPVSIEFENERLFKIAAFISTYTGLSIVIDNEVVGPIGETAPDDSPYVTDGVVPYVKLNDVPLDDALKAVLRPLDLSFRVFGDTVYISTAERLRRRDLRAKFDELARFNEITVTTRLEEGTPVNKAVEKLAELADVNIVIDAREVELADGTRSNPVDWTTQQVVAEDTPFLDVLRDIFEPHGLTFSLQPGFIWISSPDRIATESFEQLQTRMYVLDQVPAWTGDAAPREAFLETIRRKVRVVEPYTGKAMSRVAVDEEKGALVVVSTPPKLNDLENFLQKVDSPPPPSEENTAAAISDEPDWKSLPALSESERIRLGLPKLTLNIVGLATERQPRASALIDFKKVYVGDEIPDSAGTMIKDVDLEGIVVERNERLYRYDKKESVWRLLPSGVNWDTTIETSPTADAATFDPVSGNTRPFHVEMVSYSMSSRAFWRLRRGWDESGNGIKMAGHYGESRAYDLPSPASFKPDEVVAGVQCEPFGSQSIAITGRSVKTGPNGGSMMLGFSIRKKNASDSGSDEHATEDAVRPFIELPLEPETNGETLRVYSEIVAVDSERLYVSLASLPAKTDNEGETIDDARSFIIRYSSRLGEWKAVVWKTDTSNCIVNFVRVTPGSEDTHAVRKARPATDMPHAVFAANRSLADHRAPTNTTIDHQLQNVCDELLHDREGAIVVLDADTGAVLAMAGSAADAVGGAPNPAYQEAVPPGSLFKVVLAIAALEEGIITEKTTYSCNGLFRLPGVNRPWKCWRRMYGGHGGVNVIDALAYNCDVFFYNVGRDLGPEKIKKWSTKLGLGVATGIDFSDEATGLIPDPAWKMEMAAAAGKTDPSEQNWYPGETINMSIGQGSVSTTTLQNTILMAAILNGGHRVRPATNAETLSQLSGPLVSEETLRIVQAGMRKCVERDRPAPTGLGKLAKIEGFDILGKTGSPQVAALHQVAGLKEEDIPYELRDHALFIAGVMDRTPRIAVGVLIKHGLHGSSAAAPVAREVIAQFYGGDV